MAGKTRTLGRPLSSDEDRRADLRSYLVKCMRGGLISLDELRRSPLVVLARLGSTMLADVRAIGAEIRDELGPVSSEVAGNAFLEMVQWMDRKKR